MIGPVIAVICLYHLFLVKGGYPMVAVLALLPLTTLAGRPGFLATLFAPR